MDSWCRTCCWIVLHLILIGCSSPTAPLPPTESLFGNFIGAWETDNFRLSIGQNNLSVVGVFNTTIEGDRYISVVNGNINSVTEIMSGHAYSVPPEDNDGKLRMNCYTLDPNYGEGTDNPYVFRIGRDIHITIEMLEDRLSMIFTYDCDPPMNTGELLLYKTENR